LIFTLFTALIGYKSLQCVLGGRLVLLMLLLHSTDGASIQ